MRIRQLLAGLMLMMVALSTTALERQFPSSAIRGVASFAHYPKIVIDGKEYMPGPGLRIWNTQNVIEYQNGLRTENVVINYTIDAYKLIDRVWILTTEEIGKPPPAKMSVTITTPVKNTTATTTIQVP